MRAQAFQRRWEERHNNRLQQQHQSRLDMIAKRDAKGRFVSATTKGRSVNDPFSNRIKLDDLPYNPVFDPRTYECAKAWLEAHRPNASGNATYAKIWDPVDDQDCRVVEFIANVCHAEINVASPGVSLVASVIKDPIVGNEPFRAKWYDWLFNESPYRRFILSDREFAKVGIILSADMPAPILQNILILTRHGWEVQRELYELWCSAVDSGIPGWLAYATLINAKAAHAGYGGNSPQPFNLDDFYLPHQAEHRAHWLMNLQTLTNFRHGIVGLYALLPSRVTYGGNHLAKQLTDPTKSYRHVSAFYGGNSLFDDVERSQFSTNYVTELLEREDFKAIMKTRRQGVREAIPDPFNRNKPSPPPGGITYRDVMEVAMPFVLEYGLTDTAVHDPINEKEIPADVSVPEGVPQAPAAVREAAAA